MKYYGGIVSSSIHNPLPSVTAIDHYALVIPYLSKYHGQSSSDVRDRCDGVTDPLKTIDTSNRFALASAFLTKFYGTNIRSDIRLPVPTVTGQGQHIGQVQAFLIKYYGCGCGQSIGEPMHTVTSKDRLGLVTVAGQKYQIADIRLRMLRPRELARAQGFEDSYILTGTKSSQIARIGNSVCPPIAQALVAANVKIKHIEESRVG
jgi:DNA (cytosine-5)-methyltransferase 1